MTLIGPLAPYKLFENSVLTVSGGATPSATSSVIPTGMLSKLQVFVSNAGASTNVTVTIYGKPTAASTLNTPLAVFTLGATGTSSAKAGRYIEKDAIPSFIYAVATNSDAVNAASISVGLDRWR